MKEIPDAVVLEALQHATPEIKNLLGSYDLVESIRTQLQSRNNSTPPETLVLPFGYYLLNLHSYDELVTTVSDIGIPSPKEFIESVTSAVTPSNASEVVSSSEIAEMEAALERLPQVRTMATDMEHVQARESGEYVSNQDAILNRDEETPITPPTDPDEARWNSTSPY